MSTEIPTPESISGETRADGDMGLIDYTSLYAAARAERSRAIWAWVAKLARRRRSAAKADTRALEPLGIRL